MAKKIVRVVGHKNPDTDSICAAIAYANLKSHTDDTMEYIPMRAGSISAETAFVLDYFKADTPALLKDVGTQIKDIHIRRTEGVSSNLSMKKAWEMMKILNVVTLPVVNKKDKLEGLIVTGDIAKSYMDVYDNSILAKARTQYRNIIETLDGKIVAGNEHGYFVKGKVIVGAGTPDTIKGNVAEDDLVIISDREESQLICIEANCSCIIVTSGFDISKDVINAANAKDVVVISTPYDTFTTSRLINQSMPIKSFMTRENLIHFDLDDYVDDVRDTVSKIRHRDFPILDENQNYVGMFSRRNLMNARKKQVILVDHNETSQAVANIDEAEILEIIDHHRIGSLETIGPVYFRNQPLGCTATIIYQMYCEHNIDIDKTTAALLCSAIISDTLILKSPTCTHYDVDACQVLADIAGIDIEEYGREMFRAGSNLSDKSEEEIFYRDYKKFSIGEITVGVGQVNCMSQEEIEGLIKKEASYITSVTDKSDEINIAYLLLTDVMKETSYVMLSGKNAEQVLMQAFNLDEITNNYVILPGVVSRKKQFLPAIVEVLQQ